MDREQALNEFWNSFDLIAYDETSVPDTAQLPYITYEVAVSNLNNAIPLSVSVWYRSTGWKNITNKAQEILQTIGRGGTMKNYDGGAFWVTLQSPQYQRMSEPSDDMIRRIVINTMVEYFD